jgi:hypothetical protein
MKPPREFADLAHDHPLSTRATVIALRLAALALVTEHHECSRCHRNRATTLVKRDGGPIRLFCKSCRGEDAFEHEIRRQRELAATMRPR